MYTDLIHDLPDFLAYAASNLKPGWHDRGFKIRHVTTQSVLVQCSPSGPSILVEAVQDQKLSMRLVQGNRAEWGWKDTTLPLPEAARVMASVFAEPRTEKLPLDHNPYLAELAFDLGLDPVTANWDSRIPTGTTVREYALALAGGDAHPHLELVHDAVLFDEEVRLLSQ